jgi:thiamine kinase-like enzyme
MNSLAKNNKEIISRGKNTLLRNNDILVKKFDSLEKKERELKMLVFFQKVLDSKHLPAKISQKNNEITYVFYEKYKSLNNFDNQTQSDIVRRILTKLNKKRRENVYESELLKKSIRNNIKNSIYELNYKNFIKQKYDLDFFLRIQEKNSTIKLNPCITFVHGDFRTANILYSKSKNNYILIDFEHSRRYSDVNFDYGHITAECRLNNTKLLRKLNKFIENCFGYNKKNIELYQLKYFLSLMNTISNKDPEKYKKQIRRIL